MKKLDASKLFQSAWFVPAQLALAFCFGLVLRGSDPLHLVLSHLYPPEDSIGATKIELLEVPGSGPSGTKSDILLLRHELEGAQRLTVFQDGGKARSAHIFAGVSGKDASASLPKGSLNPSSLLEIEAPPGVLVVASLVMDSSNPREGHYSVASAALEKKIGQTDDLVILTSNEQRNLRYFYWLAMSTLFIVGLGVARFERLVHPKETEG